MNPFHNLNRIIARRRASGNRYLHLLVLCVLVIFTGTSGATAQSRGAADLDQIHNGSASRPLNLPDWVNGNANAQHAHFLEGHSMAYRLVLTKLTPGSHTLVIGWDTRDQSKHAFDFITHYQNLEPHAQFGHPSETVTPLRGLALSNAPMTTAAIPMPAQLNAQAAATFSGLQAAGKAAMTMFNGTAITDVHYVVQGDRGAARAETRLAITFTTANSTVVFAWGGHIASQKDWGVKNSASSINGSPYHTRLISLDGRGGNQDRSMAAAAVSAPPTPCAVTTSLAAGPAIACNGGTTTLTATATGGTAPYQYAINGGAFESTNSFTVGAGTYSVVARDARGCTSAAASQTITAPAPLVIEVGNGTIFCNGGVTLLRVLSITGGSPDYEPRGYEFSFDGGRTYSGSVVQAVRAGTYTVIVRNIDTGCTSVPVVRVIPEPAPLVATLTAPPIACGNGTTTLTAMAMGGRAPYYYSFGSEFPNSTTNTSTVGPGTYSVTVRDANNCFSTATVTVPQAPALVLTISEPVPIRCYGAMTSLRAEATGGTAPYRYSWSPEGQTAATIMARAGVNYTVTVTDASGCTSSASRSLAQPSAPLRVATAITNETCTGADGTATLRPTGGTAPYTYEWNPAGPTGATATNLTARTYYVTITDANGCRTTADVRVGKVNDCLVQHCTLTQGGYGNSNGRYCGGTRRTDLITGLLASGGNLVVGSGARTLAFTSANAAQQAACIIAALPAGGPPTALPATGGPATGCSAPASLLRNGRFNNVLLGQTIALSLNVRLDASLGSMVLPAFVAGTSRYSLASYPGASCTASGPSSTSAAAALSVTLPVSVVRYLSQLGQSNTVAGLLALANQALGGSTASLPSLADINEAVSAINELFVECRWLLAPVTAAPVSSSIAPASTEQLRAPEQLISLAALPNPGNEQVSVEFRLTTDSPATVTVHSALGAKVATLFDGPATAGQLYRLPLKTSVLASGVYFYRISLPTGFQTKRLLLVH